MLYEYNEILLKAHYGTATTDEVIWLWRVIQAKLVVVGRDVANATNMSPVWSKRDFDSLTRALSDLSRLQSHVNTLHEWWVKHELQEQNHA